MSEAASEPIKSASGGYAPLERWQRVVFGVIGAAGVGAGGAATFLTNNSAGSGVLLALGALFLLIAVTGNPITRAKVGDVEVGLGYRTAVTEILESKDQNVQQVAAEAVLDAPLPPNDPIRRRAQLIERAQEYEERVSLALQRLFGSENLKRNARGGPDFVVRFQSARIGVEVKLSAKMSLRAGAVTSERIDQALSYLSEGSSVGLDGVLIVTNLATPTDLERIRKISRLAVSVWNSEEDDVSLQTEFERIATN